jgi:hypothetical protein
VIRVRIDDVLEVALDVAPEIREALRKDGPGGRRITKAEARQIARALERALLAQVGPS